MSFFPSGLGEKDFLKQSLKLFQIDEEEWENFEIYIEVLSCKLENSNNLVMNDLLVLKSKEATSTSFLQQNYQKIHINLDKSKNYNLDEFSDDVSYLSTSSDNIERCLNKVKENQEIKNNKENENNRSEKSEEEQNNEI